MESSIKCCGIYSISSKGFFNAPFVALNDDQAKQIIVATFADAENVSDFYDLELYQLGVLHMRDGIISSDTCFVCTVADALGVSLSYGGEVCDEISNGV